MAKAPRSYGETLAAAQASLRAARLTDPGEHFPYKLDDVTSLVDENPPMGPRGPDDSSFLAEDFMTQEIAAASKDYVDAQAAYLSDPGDATRAAYENAKDHLVTVRQEHRVNRDQPAPIQRARRAGE